MATHLQLILGMTLAAAYAVGCGGKPSQPAATEAVAAAEAIPAEWPGAGDPRFAEGRQVWLADCENCHGIGKADSPRFTDTEAWAPRLVKGEAALIASAINGFEGRSEGGMPPRGGNKELTDEQVTAAVRYMIHFSRPVADGPTVADN